MLHDADAPFPSVKLDVKALLGRPVSAGHFFSVGLQSVKVWADASDSEAAMAAVDVEKRMLSLCYVLCA